MTFMHSSDLMLPHLGGLDWVQVVVVSRILDTEMWQNGETPFWHTALSDFKFTPEEKAVVDDRYLKFLERMQTTGFNPEMSCFDVTIHPIIWLNGGSHRLGYMLSKNPNIFIPIKFNATPWNFCDGIKKYSYLGAEALQKIINRYNVLYGKMRKHITAVVNLKDFLKHFNEINSSIPSDIKISLLSNLDGSMVEKAESSILPTNKESSWKKILSFCQKEIVILKIYLVQQTLHYVNDSQNGGGYQIF